jgi:M6 family metalloprotease-like protein
MAPRDKQWNVVTQDVHQTIPDNRSDGLDSDQIATDLFDGSCQQIYAIDVDLVINHPRPADLVISLSTLSRDGNRAFKTKTLFDGPKEAFEHPGVANLISLPNNPIPVAHGDAADDLLLSEDCGRFRLNVTDFRPGNVGTLVSWSLRRRTAWFPFAYTPDYYQSLLFATTMRPTAPGVIPSVVDYFLEVSRGQFTFSQAGLYGPVIWKEWLGKSDTEQVDDVIHLLEMQGFDFKQFDLNHDNVVDNNELGIVTFNNYGDEFGKKRDPDPDKPCTTVNNGSLQVCSSVAFVSQRAAFEDLTHELSHTLGAVDLYAEDCFSFYLTLMSCSPGHDADPKRSLYLDAWHRKKFAWIVPQGLTFGSTELGDETWIGFHGERARPAWIQNPADSNEYFLFEYRGRRSYDNDVGDIGLVVWHVKEDGNGNAYKGQDGKETEGHAIYAVSPDNARGGRHAWQPEDGRFQVMWADGTYLARTFWVEQPRGSASSILLYWADAPVNNKPPSIEIVRPHDKSSGPYGFGNLTTFEAKVTDARGSTDGLRISWSSDVDGNLGAGSITNIGFIAPGVRHVTVTARDVFGATASKTIEFTANKVSPTVTIYSPAAGQRLFRNQPVRLLAFANNPVSFALSCDSLQWTLDRLPSWSISGCDSFQRFDVLGSAQFHVRATDEFNTSGSANVSVQFADPPLNSPPLVVITAPPQGPLSLNIPVRVTGEVTDPAGGPVYYRWTVFDTTNSNETELARTSAFNWTPFSLFPNGGSIELRLYGTNGGGVTTRASVPYVVLAPLK